MHDFANYRNSTDLVSSRSEATEWSPDIPSLMMGVIVGVFLAIVGFKVVEYRAEQAVLVETPEVEETEGTPLVLEFYEALKDYKVLPRG